MGALSWYCAGVNYLLFFVLSLSISVVLIIFNGSVSHVETGELLHIFLRKNLSISTKRFRFSNNGRAVCFPKGWFRCITLQWHGNQTNAGIKHIVSCVLFTFYTVFFSVSRWFLSAVNG